jgi:hypothetical protein
MKVIKNGRIIQAVITHFHCTIAPVKLNDINFIYVKYNKPWKP